MIDISCRFYLQNNDLTYTYCINLVEAITRHQQLLLTVQLLLQQLLYIPCKNLRKLLTSCVVFAVNRYECFMEDKNMIKTFCGCKLSKKATLSLIKILLFLIKKREGSGLIPKYTEYQKVITKCEIYKLGLFERK